MSIDLFNIVSSETPADQMLAHSVCQRNKGDKDIYDASIIVLIPAISHRKNVLIPFLLVPARSTAILQGAMLC